MSGIVLTERNVWAMRRHSVPCQTCNVKTQRAATSVCAKRDSSSTRVFLFVIFFTGGKVSRKGTKSRFRRSWGVQRHRGLHNQPHQEQTVSGQERRLHRHSRQLQVWVQGRIHAGHQWVELILLSESLLSCSNKKFKAFSRFLISTTKTRKNSQKFSNWLAFLMTSSRRRRLNASLGFSKVLPSKQRRSSNSDLWRDVFGCFKRPSICAVSASAS